MNALRLILALLLLPISASAQGIRTVTLLEGSLQVMRGTGVQRGAEAMNPRPGDILESSDKGIVQLEFVEGTVVVLGPASLPYIFRHAGNGEQQQWEGEKWATRGSQVHFARLSGR